MYGGAPPAYQQHPPHWHQQSSRQHSHAQYRPKSGDVREFDKAKDRNRLQSLADFYAIIRATESIEAAFARDDITPSAYSEACTRLISQFKATESALVQGGIIENADKFFKEYTVDCPRATERLLRVGVPATVVHATHDDRSDTVVVAQTTQAFITAMDALKLDQRAVDQVQPLISDITSSLNRVQGIPAEFHGLVKVRLWLMKLNQMRAVDEIAEEEARQLLFDLESSYTAFMEYLSHGNKK
jgi:ESCRT-I complex subunit VPS28